MRLNLVGVSALFSMGDRYYFPSYRRTKPYRICHKLWQIWENQTYLKASYLCPGDVTLFCGQDFYIDLLFYHIELRCFIVIDLKMKDFKPEYAGKLNFYLSAVDNLLKHETNSPTIGIVLCKANNKVIAEYALPSACISL